LLGLRGIRHSSSPSASRPMRYFISGSLLGALRILEGSVT
jgi:hypothetical protein